jgi:hypothetical protein
MNKQHKYDPILAIRLKNNQSIMKALTLNLSETFAGKEDAMVGLLAGRSNPDDDDADDDDGESESIFRYFFYFIFLRLS